MDHVPTGFPALDDVLQTGLLQPSCICLTGVSNNQSIFVFQLVHNFLKRGLKGLYVCFDRPSSEIKSQFTRFGLDLGSYSEDYSLFFIDFFSESQAKLIETARIDVLRYEPNYLLVTLSPFLDWIKNGFIIVDSFSTVTLNMDAKEAYNLIRGLNLLGRAFNLVILGLSNTTASDPKILEMINSTSDGNLIFNEQILLVNKFENARNEPLLISTNPNRTLNLKAALPPGTNGKTGADLLGILAKNGSLQTTPTLDLAVSPKTGYSFYELSSMIKRMEEEKILESVPRFVSVRCPHCGAQSLELYLQCPDCGNRLLEKGDIIEHFSCGHVDFELNFQANSKLVCPKCVKELKQIGVDYKKLGIGYQCSNKHLFTNPRLTLVCANCNEKFNIEDAKLESQYTYTLTEKGKHLAKELEIVV
jgi:KaiC/GvpD/RAD55 family RecA-like ATPase/DNA-directed RNA polymerase subunit RPC12/RpoP